MIFVDKIKRAISEIKRKREIRNRPFEKEWRFSKEVFRRYIIGEHFEIKFLSHTEIVDFYKIRDAMENIALRNGLKFGTFSGPNHLTGRGYGELRGIFLADEKKVLLAVGANEEMSSVPFWFRLSAYSEQPKNLREIRASLSSVMCIRDYVLRKIVGELYTELYDTRFH